MTTETYATLLEKGLAAVRDGSGVVLDATFSNPSTRAALVRECAQAGVRLQLIELESDRETIQKRLKARDDTTAEVSDARLGDFEDLNATYVPPTEFGADLIRTPTSGAVLDAVKAVLLLLAERQAARPLRKERRFGL